jgi:hypothetical protein
MDLTDENVAKWFDAYFEEVNNSQGPIEQAVNLRKYFTPDFMFHMYTAPPFFQSPLSRDKFLMLFVHPGLHESFRLGNYVIDLNRMRVVVQFEIQFADDVSGESFAPKQCSAHYWLELDENRDLKIKEIKYWTETSASDEAMPLQKVWIERRTKALTDFAEGFLDGRPVGGTLSNAQLSEKK